jgi:molybdopterin biosynthesis enzyme
MGLEDGLWHGASPARLTGELPAAPSRDRIVPVRCRHHAEGLIARPLGVRGSHDVAAFAVADGLVRVRRGEEARTVGSVEVLPF